MFIGQNFNCFKIEDFQKESNICFDNFLQKMFKKVECSANCSRSEKFQGVHDLKKPLRIYKIFYCL